MPPMQRLPTEADMHVDGGHACVNITRILHTTHIMHAGVHNTKLFAALATDADGFRRVMANMFGWDPAASVENLIQVARLHVAWENAKCRSATTAKAEAEAQVLLLPKVLPGQELMAMRKAFTLRFHKLRDEEAPARQYVEFLCDKIEKGEYRAERLEEVVDYAQTETNDLVQRWDQASGTFKPSRVAMVKPTPKDTE